MLERAADRVTNICERVVFTVTGEMVEMNVMDGRFTEERLFKGPAAPNLERAG